MNTLLSSIALGLCLLLQTSGAGGKGGFGGNGGMGGGFTASATPPSVPSGGSCNVDSPTIVTSMACAPSAATVLGDLVYVASNWLDNEVPVCSDSLGNSIAANPATAPGLGGWPVPGGSSNFYSFTITVTNAGSDTITCHLPTHTPGNFPWMVVAIIRGSTSFQGGTFFSANSSTFGGGDYNGTAITPSSNNSLMIITCATDHHDPTTINAPSTTLEHPTVNNGGWFSMGYAIVNAVSSAPTCHNPFSNNVIAEYEVYP